MLSNIKKLYIIFCIALLVFFSLPLAVKADAGVPTTLSYQGLLTDSGGNVLGAGGTSYYFKFSLWDSPTVGSGTKLWPSATPTATTLTVKQGVFTVNIGDTTNGYPDALNYNFNTNSKIYLQVEVSGNNINFETLTPRSQIAANAFSQVSNQVNGTGASSFGTTTPFANTLISAISTAISQVTMSIKAIAGQVADLFNVSDSTGNTIFNVTAGGNVGVGTTSPAAKLDVWGNLRVGTSSTPLFFANSATGFVGIGTTTPANKLDVWGNLSVGTSSTPNLFVNTSSNFVGIGTNLQATSTAKLSLAGGISWITGLGAISHIIGPTDQPFVISSNAGQAASAVTGNDLTLKASNGLSGLSVNGGAAGGNLTITAGDATGGLIGNSAAGGNINITGGTGYYNSDSGSVIIKGGSMPTGQGTIGKTGGVSISTQASLDSTITGPVGVISITTGKGGNVSISSGGFGANAGAFLTVMGGGGSNSGNTSGTGGNGGVYTITGGAGGNATGAGGTHLGGTGSTLSFFSGIGGSATGASGTRTGGNSGNIAFIIGTPGTGSTTAGVAGNMFLTETYGNIGIGIASTTAPWAKLAIQQAYGGTSPLFDVASTTSAGNATSSLFRILANGRVGIGTASPGNSLEISGSSYTGIDLRDTSGSAGTKLRFLETAADTGIDLLYNSSVNTISFIDVGSSASYFTISRNGASSGNVGIGTSTPSQKLDIWGNLNVGTSSTPNLFVNTGSGNVGIGNASPSNPLSVTGNTSISRSLAIGSASSITDPDNIFSSIASGASQGGGTISAKHSSIGFGHAVGNNITASGYGSFAGGYSTSGVITASGNGSFAFGNNVTSISESSISFGTGFSNTIGSSFMVGFGSTTPAFTVNGTKVGIGTTTPAYLLSLSGGAYSDGTNWTNGSSKDIKENYSTLDKQAVLDKISQLDIEQWNYKGEDQSVKHIGPFAEDFFSLFGLGGTNKAISTIDPAGVALIGIQALAEKINMFGTYITKTVDGIIGNFKEVRTEKLCVGDTCITQSDLETMIRNNALHGSAPTPTPASTSTPTNPTPPSETNPTPSPDATSTPPAPPAPEPAVTPAPEPTPDPAPEVSQPAPDTTSPAPTGN